MFNNENKSQNSTKIRIIALNILKAATACLRQDETKRLETTTLQFLQRQKCIAYRGL